MKVSKLTNFSRIIISFLCLLVLLGVSTPHGAMAEMGEIVGSVEDQGIKLTVNRYDLQNHSTELIVYYTVETMSTDHISENITNLIKRPDISIGDNPVKGKSIWQKKISNQKYQGAVKAELSQYRPEIAYVAFHTNSILNKKGNWEVNFQIHK